ncbi:hypothetical protein vBYenSP400_40 [Yersinia phage vB_YenS_P400]|nr:hypothetical protein vBYenSP400_40 [Yersinia phage vB_YenS_P400]
MSKAKDYADTLAERADVIVDGGKSQQEIINVLKNDFKRLGNPLQLYNSFINWQLNKGQVEILESMAVKVLALKSMGDDK